MSDDLIRRSDAIKAIDELPNAYNGWSDAYDKAYIISTLEEVPSADRPTVIRVKSIMKNEDYDNLKKMIKQQNSNVIVIPHNAELVTPADRPQGKWLDYNGKPTAANYSGTCSVCGCWSEYLLNYCPNCGAKMKGADDE